MTDSPPRHPLTLDNAVGAILVTPDGRFLMQQRDAIPEIWYPGAWGLFGGGIDPGETELEALRRELDEEIGFALGTASLFGRFHFECSFVGATVFRSFYEVPIEPQAVDGLQLREGSAMALIPAERALALPDVIGYDQFALYLYVHRQRVRPPPGAGSTAGPRL